MLLEELAEELVDVTSSLVGGRTINIMNTDGVIIASSERGRVGSYHQGAIEAVRTGRVVNIREDQLERYPGAREGCNMPLRVNGSIIGVVGIYGDPDQIQDVAHLLEVYAAKCYQLEAMLQPRLAESALRSQLLLGLLSPSDTPTANLNSLMERLNIRISFPAVVAVISSPQGLSRPRQAEALTHRLEQLGFLRRQCDVWGIVEQRMVLLCSAIQGRRMEALAVLTEAGCRVSLGASCATVWEIRRSYDQASILDLIGKRPFQDIRDPAACCGYLLHRTALQEEGELEKLAAKLIRSAGQENAAILLNSAEVYFDCGHSVSQASQQLYIHKNTLQYRIRRVIDALDLGSLPPFCQEYLVRLVIAHLRRKAAAESSETQRPPAKPSP